LLRYRIIHYSASFYGILQLMSALLFEAGAGLQLKRTPHRLYWSMLFLICFYYIISYYKAIEKNTTSGRNKLAGMWL